MTLSPGAATSIPQVMERQGAFLEPHGDVAGTPHSSPSTPPLVTYTVAAPAGPASANRMTSTSVSWAMAPPERSSVEAAPPVKRLLVVPHQSAHSQNAGATVGRISWSL